MLKKLFSTLTLFLIAFAFCGCDAASYFGESPKYYAPNVSAYYVNTDSWKDNASELSAFQMQIATEVYDNVTSYFGIEKNFPRILAVDEMPNPDYEALYEPLEKTIYVKRGITSSSENKNTLAHEFIHYLSANPKDESLVGFEYILHENWMFGFAFNEGSTSYLANQVYPTPDSDPPYVYEFHLAQLFANAIGEENFRNYFFSADIEDMRDIFNIYLQDIYPIETDFSYFENIELTPYDVFMGSVNTYQNLKSIYEDSIVESIRETLYNDSYFEDGFNSVEEDIELFDSESEEGNDYLDSDCYIDEYSDWDRLVQLVNSLEEEVVIFNHISLRDVSEIVGDFLDNTNFGGMLKEQSVLETFLPPEYEYFAAN